jgi:mannose-6-phosphate isomerase-like protein (cupin superfamily)
MTHVLLLSTFLLSAAPTPQAQSRTRATLTIVVTDPAGATVPGVKVHATGAVTRDGETDDDGAVAFRSLPAGVMRLRFEGDGFITLERDVSVRAGQPAEIGVTLNPAPAPLKPEPKAAPPPVTSPPPAPRPAGEPRTLSIPDFVEKNFIGRGGQKESVLGCTVGATSRLIQLRDPLPDHVHADADEELYVIAGEGIVRVGGREEAVTSGVFSVIPRGTPHAITRKGRNPLILLSTLSGEPCSGEAKK